MRRERHVIFYRAVMPNVIAAPKDDIVADRRKRLNRIVFKNEAVVANLSVDKYSRFRANIANNWITFALNLLIHELSQFIHSSRGHWREKRKFSWRVRLLDRF